MTALCPGGGPSRPLPGIGDNIQLTTSGLLVLADLLAIPGIGEVIALAAAGTYIATPTYCANDPPPDPILTAADVGHALLVTDPTTSIPAIARISQWVLHTYWWSLCECVNAATPPRPAPSNPGGSQSTPGVGNASPKPCFNWNGALTLPAALSSGQIKDYTGLVFPAAVPVVNLTPPGVTGTVAAVPVTPGLKSITTTVTLDANDSLNSGGFVLVGYWDSAHASLRQDTIGQGSTHSPITLTNFVAPTGAAFWAVYVQEASSAGVQSDWAVQLAVDCGGSGITTDCCPPDPSVDLRLKQITELILELLNRGPDSVGYQLGTAHGPVSGTASISIPGGRGMKAHINTGTPTTPQLAGNPPYEWNLGWMSILTGDGMIEERRITRQDQLWFATGFPLATTFGYYLNPGVVATFTELIAPA